MKAIRRYSSCSSGLHFILNTGMSLIVGSGVYLAGAASLSHAIYSLPSFSCCLPPCTLSLSSCRNTSSFFSACRRSRPGPGLASGLLCWLSFSLISWNSGVSRDWTLFGRYWYSIAEFRLVCALKSLTSSENMRHFCCFEAIFLILLVIVVFSVVNRILKAVFSLPLSAGDKMGPIGLQIPLGEVDFGRICLFLGGFRAGNCNFTFAKPFSRLVVVFSSSNCSGKGGIGRLKSGEQGPGASLPALALVS